MPYMIVRYCCGLYIWIAYYMLEYTINVYNKLPTTIVLLCTVNLYNKYYTIATLLSICTLYYTYHTVIVCRNVHVLGNHVQLCIRYPVSITPSGITNTKHILFCGALCICITHSILHYSVVYTVHLYYKYPTYIILLCNLHLHKKYPTSIIQLFTVHLYNK